MQTNCDDDRLCRANGEINELRKQLAAARENSEKLARRCAETEASGLSTMRLFAVFVGLNYSF
jgi:hypothetical protein